MRDALHANASVNAPSRRRRWRMICRPRERSRSGRLRQTQQSTSRRGVSFTYKWRANNDQVGVRQSAPGGPGDAFLGGLRLGFDRPASTASKTPQPKDPSQERDAYSFSPMILPVSTARLRTEKLSGRRSPTPARRKRRFAHMRRYPRWRWYPALGGAMEKSSTHETSSPPVDFTSLKDVSFGQPSDRAPRTGARVPPTRRRQHSETDDQHRPTGRLGYAG